MVALLYLYAFATIFQSNAAKAVTLSRLRIRVWSSAGEAIAAGQAAIRAFVQYISNRQNKYSILHAMLFK
jgi:hypothetical protein